jgi:hypothetical protein
MARPTTYSPTILPAVKAAAHFGATAEEIAEYLDVSMRSFKGWMYNEPALRDAMKRGRDASDERVIESLYRKALTGDVGACCFWLKNRRPSEWRDVHNINADVGHYILSNAPMSEDEWIAARTKVIDSKAIEVVATTLPDTEDETAK